MNVEYLARQYEITPAVRGEVEDGLTKLQKILGENLKSNGRRRATTRKAKDKSWKAPVEADTETQIAIGSNAKTAVPVVVHKFPSIARTTEAHLVKSTDSIAMRPMTIEEAVKECEFRDRDVFVFRDGKGRVKVLHRRKDGKIELIEVP